MTTCIQVLSGSRWLDLIRHDTVALVGSVQVSNWSQTRLKRVSNASQTLLKRVVKLVISWTTGQVSDHLLREQTSMALQV